MDNLPLPQDKNSEMGILSSLLQNPAKATAVCDSKNLQEDWFNDADHQKAYRYLRLMIKEGRPVDLITVNSYFSDRYKEIGLATPNIHGFITELFTFVPTWSNIGYYITCVQEMAAKRFALIAAMEVQKKLREPMGLQEIHTTMKSCFTKAEEVCVEQDEDTDYDQKAMMCFLDRLEDDATGKNKIDFFPTSFPTIDNECGGIARGELMLVRGRKGTGKSLWLQAILQNNIFSARKSRVALFTYEMMYDQMMRRMVASKGRISLNSMRHGTYNEGELRRFNASMSEIMTTNLRIFDTERLKGRRTPEAIFSTLRKLAKNEGCDLVGVDHLHLLKFVQKGKMSEKRTDEFLHDFSAELKATCLELKIGGVLLAQENVDGGTFGGTQVETDVDSSYSLVPETKMINGQKRIVGTKSVFCDKCREGNLLGRIIPLVMEGAFATIREGEPEKQDAAF